MTDDLETLLDRLNEASVLLEYAKQQAESLIEQREHNDTEEV